MSARQWFIKYWFMIGLVLLALLTAADGREWTVGAGRYLKDHDGPEMVIFAIFLFSGISLDAGLLRKGLEDIQASAAALMIIFLFSPLVALGFHFIPLNIQILTGLYLVAVMPSTLSSGVVMTHASGGNMAHALFITIVANVLAVFSIPVVLSLLLATVGDARYIQIDKAAIMFKITLLVVMPLVIGMAFQAAIRPWMATLRHKAHIINQVLVLAIVWMGMCQSRATLMAGSQALAPITAVCIGFHLALVLIALALVGILGIESGRRESVIFMGGQKTLPLSVILQVTLFPDYGLALAVCVVHHILHLIMDAYLVERLRISP